MNSMNEIARALGMSRTVVCKVLNRDPKYTPNKKTKELVLNKAKEMNYDFSKLHTRYRREHERKEVNIPTKVVIRTKKDNKIFNKGTAVIKNISEGGALISNMKFSKNCLPINPFTFELKLNGGGFKNCTMTGNPVRVTSNDEMNLGVVFENISDACKEKIRVLSLLSHD